MADSRVALRPIAASRQRSNNSPPATRASVPAVARAARLLDTLAATRQSLSVSALAKTLALPKSTVHGLCVTLAQAGLMERLDNGTYQLGTRVMDLANAYLAHTDPVAEFQAIIKAQTPMPDESIVLSVLDGPDIVYVGCRNGTHAFGFNFRIGMRLPANCTASGKALLSSRSAQHVVDLARARAFYPLTRKSITNVDRLLEQLRQAAARGYALDDEETRQGMLCIGAPIFSAASSEAVAAVGVSLSKAALNAKHKAQAIETVKKLASDISHRLGSRRTIDNRPA